MCLPHCRPPSPFPSTLDDQHAAVAARLLSARVATPVHCGGFHVHGHHETAPNELDRFVDACHDEDFAVEIPAPGEAFRL